MTEDLHLPLGDDCPAGGDHQWQTSPTAAGGTVRHCLRCATEEDVDTEPDED